MSYGEVAKIYGKPDVCGVDKQDKSKQKCEWQIWVISDPQEQYVPLDKDRLEEAKKEKMDPFIFDNATIEFINGKVEMINLSKFWPG